MSATADYVYSPRTGTSKRLHHMVLEYRGVELTVAYTCEPYRCESDWAPEAHVVSVTVGRDCVDVARLVDIDDLEYELDRELLGRGE